MTADFPSADILGDELGDTMYSLIRNLYPINRSITGDGLRATFDILRTILNIRTTEITTGTQVFDWQIPKEWSIRDAYIKDSRGRRIVDYRKHNLHVVNYSTPVHKTISLSDLLPRLHTIPDHCDWIPYRTTYYDDDWGFCLSQNTLNQMRDDEYEVCIDSEHKTGALTYAEYEIPGELQDEVLFFAHACHPSLCNDNLSGIAVATILAKQLSERKNRLSYRFVFAPATIGSIAWLSQNEAKLHNITAGLVLSVIGDDGSLVYKRSRHETALIDRAAEHVLSNMFNSKDVRGFSPWGYDERQFCSPGINLPIGRLTRTPNGEYPEYHTSADNLDFVKPNNLLDSLRAVWSIVQVLEGDGIFVNQLGKGEPQLGRRGLYRSMGGYQDVAQHQMAMLWILNQSDGFNSLLDIAINSDISFPVIRQVTNDLLSAHLIKPINTNNESFAL